MKLQVYTTMSPTKQNKESDNDIDIARQQLDTAKEKVASSLKIYERYNSQNAAWREMGAGPEVLDISGISYPLPAKKDTSDIDEVERQCRKRIRLHKKNVPDFMARDMDRTVDILMGYFVPVFIYMPIDIRDILRNDLLNGQCNYVLLKDGLFKVGDGGDCIKRINQQIDEEVTSANFNEYGFTLAPVETYIPSGLVKQSMINELLALHHQPMLSGLDGDKRAYDIYVNKMLRQIVELYVSCSYEFDAPGPVGEWLLRAPSKLEWKVNSFHGIDAAIRPKEQELQKVINMRTARQLGKVIDKDTWITIPDELALEPSLEYFRNPHYHGLTPHLAKSNVDEDHYGDFFSMIDISPYLTKVMPKIDELNELLERGDLSVSDVQPIFNSIELEPYQEPNEKEHCQRGYDFISKLDEKHTNDIHRMRFDTIDTLRSGEHCISKGVFKTLFGLTIEFTGLKFVNTDEGIGVEEGVVFRIHLTKKHCNIIFERASHFRAFAPNARTVDRLNAIYNYNYESFIMYKIGKLSDKGLHKIQQSSLTRTMLIMGIDKQGTNEGNFWHALKFTSPNGVSDGGLKTGQVHLQGVITISSEVTDRDTLPIDLIYLMIWKVPEFNKLVILYEGKIRIGSEFADQRLYLLVPDKDGTERITYWRHYDAIHRDRSVTKAVSYIKKVRGRSEPLLLDVAGTTLHELYNTIDEENFATNERQSLFLFRGDQFLNKFKREDNLLSEAMSLFLSQGGYAQLKVFLAHVDHMDELFKQDENQFVDQDQNIWLVLVGRNLDTLRSYLLELMNKTGRENELMRQHLLMKGYSNMANRDKYNEVRRMYDATSEAGRMQAEAQNMVPDEDEEDDTGPTYDDLPDYLGNMWENLNN